MPKNLQQRVRAQIEKAERDAKRAEAAKVNRVTDAQIRADFRREERIDGLCDGSIMPRNAKEQAIADRAMLDDFDGWDAQS